MEFFRNNRKLIVGILVVFVGFWFLGATVLVSVLSR